MWQGAGKGYQDVLMVTLGTGVGGGCVLDGKTHLIKEDIDIIIVN